MLNKKDLENAIADMERNLTSYNEVEKLAHLYVIYDRNFPETTEEQELTEVLPALRQYQKEPSERNLERLCGEVFDFIKALNASTYSPTQREIIKRMLDRCLSLW